MSNSIFDWIHLIAENVWLYGGAFLLVLGILVFVHEWGHYITARLCGVKIESFSIGFGPELFGVTDKRGTRWKFSLVPLGGYVKMFGDVDPASARHAETVEDEKTQDIRPLTTDERKYAFFSQPVLNRALIVFAGPAINFLFAIIIMATLFVIYGQPVTPPRAAAIIQGSAADIAGFRPHDEILSIDGRKIRRFEDIRREIAVGLDTARTFSVLRDGRKVTLTATPHKMEETDHFGFSHTRGLLGVISPGNGISIDSIVAVDGKATKSTDETRALLARKMDTSFTIEMKSAGEHSDKLLIAPLSSLNKALLEPGEGPDHNALIVANVIDDVVVKHNPLSAVSAAGAETANITINTLQALWQMISGTRSASELGGIIRIGAMAGDMAKSGFVALVTFTALLSINLGLVNLFPIPMLDGGHLVFYTIEAVRGAPISEQVQEYAFRLGLAILVGIMLFANLNDIVQLIL